jgi:hypothetical protein
LAPPSMSSLTASMERRGWPAVTVRGMPLTG